MTMRGKLLALTALAAMGEGMMYNEAKRIRVDPDSEDQKLTKQKAFQELQQSKGLKWFNIDGVHVLALNRKNAERKAKKLKP